MAHLFEVDMPESLIIRGFQRTQGQNLISEKAWHIYLGMECGLSRAARGFTSYPASKTNLL